MQKKRFNFVCTLLLTCCFLILCISRSSSAASFSGEVTEVKNGRTSVYKIFFQGSRYRLDMKAGNKTFIVLVNRETGKTSVLDSSQKVFRELENNSMNSLMQNPFESHLHMTKTYTVRKIGVEDVNGLVCNKQIIEITGKDALTAWVSPKYDFPVKLINHINNYTAQINGLKPIPPLNPDFFAVPEGYSQFEEPAPEVTAPDEKQTLPQTSDGASMILVLDASGSMWGQLNGKAKIDIAKEVMTELIDDIPKNFQTGLTVYGHRRKGDCNDIEMLILPGPHNPSEMKKKIMAISPKGKTPLSEAVKQAAEALKYTEKKATVVLVSDGLETCHTDPCGLAAELAMTGVDFTVHVIGFDISEGDQERLRCLADKTGGLFLSAGNAGSLRDALFKTVEKIKEPPAPVVEDPGIATLSGPKTVAAGSAFSVAWQGPDSKGDFIAISIQGPDDLRYKEYQYTRTGNPVELTAPGDIGMYELRYIHAYTKKIIGRSRIQITPVEASVKVPPSAKAASEFDVTWQGPDYPGDYISIAAPDEPVGRYLYYTYIKNGNPLKLRSPSDAGTYEIRYIMAHDNKLLAKTTITIEATTAQVHAPESAPVATQFEVAWTGPDNKMDYISIARPDQRAGSYVNYTYTKDGSPLKIWAPSDPGTYEIRYIQNQGTKILAATTIEIEPVTADVKAPDATVAGTKFDVTWQGPNQKSDYISIARSDQKAGSYLYYTYTNNGNPLKLQAPPEAGTYEIRYILGRGDKLLAKTSITIDPVTASLQAPGSAAAGSVIEVAWQGPGYRSDYIAIARPDQRSGSYVGYTYTNNGNTVKLKMPKEAGNYEIRYIMALGTKLLAKVSITITP